MIFRSRARGRAVVLRSRAVGSACAIALFFTLGCGHDEPFLGLQELCPELASDVCTARNQGCCPQPVDQASCEASERAACMADQGAYALEAGRRYDSVAAARERQAVQAVLDACGAPPTLAAFFQDGLPLGTACERASQCASGACSGQPGACTEVATHPLCAP